MKLRYYYGTMNSAKSANILMKTFQFEQSGCRVFLFKPAFDTRDLGEIRSRAIKYSRECFVFTKDVNVRDLVINVLQSNTEGEEKPTVLFFDEINFMTREQVFQLWRLSKEFDLDIYCYGLKLSYNNRLFDATEELIIMADTIEEIKSMCSRCKNKAKTHLRIVNGKAIFGDKDYIVGDISGEERYESVCTECWMKEHEKWRKENLKN